ncbi:hypothetical protein Tco_1103628 [Tanacetum coccineum]
MACVIAMSHDHLGNGALPNKGIKSPSKLLSPKYQSQSSLGEQDRNSSSPKRVHFINTITIISKEDKPREIGIIEPNIKDNDHDTIVEVEEKVGKKFSGSETVIEEAKSWDIERGNLETRDESVYESLIEKMSSCSLSFDFRIEIGDPSNLKIPCMIGRNTSHVMDFTILESIEVNIDPSLSQNPYKGSKMVDLTNEGHDLLSSRVILSKDDYRRGCERAYDLESGFYMDVDKLDPSYKEETDRINLDGSFKVDTMADINILANDAPAEQAPAVISPTRTDDQILPLSKWVPIDKSNCILDVHKPQRNPIFPIVVALLKNTNFFRAFTASSTISAIYIQQFWDTMCFNSSTRLYSCQLDEKWFNLYKDILKDALDITPTNDNNHFVAPPSSDTVIEYVNIMGYPSTLRNVSAMSVNALYQPWRAILSMINMCLTGKTAGYDRPRHHEESSYDCTWKEEDRSSAHSKCQVHQTDHPSSENQAQHSPKDWVASLLLT